jgi:hypothetical protein
VATTTLRMTKRSRNGARSRKYHAVPDGLSAARTAICGARPNIGLRVGGQLIGKQGWGEAAGRALTCAACIATLGARP